MELSQITNAKKVCGYLQSVRAVNEGQVGMLVLAVDCDDHYKSNVYKVAAKHNVAVEELFTKEQLSRACKILVDTALVAILK